MQFVVAGPRRRGRLVAEELHGRGERGEPAAYEARIDPGRFDRAGEGPELAEGDAVVGDRLGALALGAQRQQVAADSPLEGIGDGQRNGKERVGRDLSPPS